MDASPAPAGEGCGPDAAARLPRDGPMEQRPPEDRSAVEAASPPATPRAAGRGLRWTSPRRPRRAPRDRLPCPGPPGLSSERPFRTGSTRPWTSWRRRPRLPAEPRPKLRPPDGAGGRRRPPVADPSRGPSAPWRPLWHPGRAGPVKTPSSGSRLRGRPASKRAGGLGGGLGQETPTRAAGARRARHLPLAPAFRARQTRRSESARAEVPRASRCQPSAPETGPSGT